MRGCLILITILLFNFTFGQVNSAQKTPGFSQKNEERSYDSIVKSMNYKEGDKVTVYTQFKVNENGEIIDITARGPHRIFEKQAINLVKELQKFDPGKFKGKPTETKYVLPVTLVVGKQKKE